MATSSADDVRRVDEYLAGTPEPQRSTLTALRAMLRELLPDAVEGMSYNMPVFKVSGKAVAGYASFTRHCAYLPHSGSVFTAMADELAGYTFTQGSLHFPVDEVLPLSIVRALVAARRAELGL